MNIKSGSITVFVILVVIALIRFGSDFFHNHCGDVENLDASLKDCTASIAQGKDLPVSYSGRGLTYLFQEKYQLAVADFNEALKLNPKDATALQLRGRAYRNLEDYENALKDLDAAIQLKADFWDALVDRAVVYIAMKNYKLAQHDLDIVWTRGPRYFDKQRYTQNILYVMSGRNAEAIEHLDTEIQVKPRIPILYLLRGTAHFNAGHFSEAADDMSKVIDLGFDDGNPYYYRGLAKWIKDGPASAISDFEAAVKTESKNAYYPIWLHLARQRMGQDDAAEFTKNIERDFDSKWEKLLADFFQDKSNEDALIAFANADTSDAKNNYLCEAHFYAAQRYALKNVKDKALEEFNLAQGICASESSERQLIAPEIKALEAK